MFKIQRKDGFASFLEVVISAMIFMIAGFGIFTAISTLTPQTQDSNTRLQATLLAKNMLDTIYSDIDASDWNDCDGVLPDGPLCPGTSTQTIGSYNITKIVEDLGAPTNLRKVTLTIDYPE